MKILRTGVLVLFSFYLLQFFSCSDSAVSTLDPQQQATKILNEGSPWGGNGNVEVLSSPIGVDPMELDGLQLVFDSDGADNWAPTFLSASGADDFFSANNALWYWSGSGTDIITLEEASAAELTSVEVTDESVTFSFDVNPSNSGGRITGIDGSYRVRLK